LRRDCWDPGSFYPWRKSLSPRVSIEKADTFLHLGNNEYCILCGGTAIKVV